MPISIAPLNGQSSSKKGTFDEKRYSRKLSRRSKQRSWTHSTEDSLKCATLLFGYNCGFHKLKSYSAIKSDSTRGSMRHPAQRRQPGAHRRNFRSGVSRSAPKPFLEDIHFQFRQSLCNPGIASRRAAFAWFLRAVYSRQVPAVECWLAL
jgi:hypothetical protein